MFVVVVPLLFLLPVATSRSECNDKMKVDGEKRGKESKKGLKMRPKLATTFLYFLLAANQSIDAIPLNSFTP